MKRRPSSSIHNTNRIRLCLCNILRSSMEHDDTESALRLDPKDFPRSIELELPDEVIEGINAVAQKTGRSFSEVATDILSRALND